MLQINLPENAVIPGEISLFTPNDNLLMILIGSKSVLMFKNNYLSENENEEITKIRTEYENQLNAKDTENRLIKKIYDEITIDEKAKLDIMTQTTLLLEKNALQKQYSDILKRCDSENKQSHKTIENLTSEIEKFKNEMSIIEIDNVKKDESMRNYHIINELKIENEVNNRIKEKENDMKKEFDDYKEKMILKEREYFNSQILSAFNENSKSEGQQNEIIFLKDKLNNLMMQIEKEKNERLTDTIDMNNKSISDITILVDGLRTQTTVNKSNARGCLGENYFLNLALQTFCDCSNFEIIDKSKTPHSGDFWLKFDKFTIMVDTKNYIDTPVPSRDRQKLKNDISYNQHIKIAWLVSMDQPILTYSNYPFMIDIDDGVCYCYINSLMKSENPANLLRMAWYASNFVNENLLNVDNDISLIGKYQKNEIRIKGILNKMLVQSKERFATLNQLTENFKTADSDIRDCLNEEIRDVRTQHIEIIESWWCVNTTKRVGGKLKSTEIHKRFVSNEENRRYGIDVDMFKQILRSIPSLRDEEIVRGKTDKAQYIILGFNFTQ
jgi:hypothetical protein